jgi:hypothetical protein
VRVNETTGEVIEVIERANARLIDRLGSEADGKPTVGDPACRKRSQPMRLCGTVNYKTGRYARIVQADLARAPYPPEELVGDLPDPPWALAHRVARLAPAGDDRDPYKRIPAAEYMARLAGRRPDREGKVRCPAPGHPDEHPSCSVTGPNPECWQCQSCGAAGSIYDLASLVLGGPYGSGRLRGDEYRRARELVVATFGELKGKGGRA